MFLTVTAVMARYFNRIPQQFDILSTNYEFALVLINTLAEVPSVALAIFGEITIAIFHV